MRIFAVTEANGEGVIDFYTEQTDAERVRDALNADADEGALEARMRAVDLEGGAADSESVHAVVEFTRSGEELIAAFAERGRADEEVEALGETDSRDGMARGAYSVCSRALRRRAPAADLAMTPAFA